MLGRMKLALALTSLLVLACSVPRAHSLQSPERADAAPAPQGYVLAGRVVDARHESWPRGEVVVRLYQGEDEERVDLAVSSDGSFRFELAQRPERARIFVPPPRGAGWRWCAPHAGYARPLSDAELDGEEPLVLEIAQLRRGRLRGKCVDALTGEPLPGLELSLLVRRGLERERVSLVTDALGHFVTAGEYDGGSVEVRAAENGPQPTRSWEHFLVGAETESLLRFDVGPALHLALSGAVPDDLGQLVAKVYSTDSLRCVVEAELRSSGPDVWLRPPGTPLRAGQRVWVAVQNREGTLLGAASCPWEANTAQRPLHVELEATAALTRDAQGRRESIHPIEAGVLGRVPFATRLELQDTRLADPFLPWRLAHFDGLRPGAYVLTCTLRSGATRSMRYELAAGERRALERGWQMDDSDVPKRTLHGVLRSRAGTELPPLEFVAYMLGRAECPWHVELAGPMTCVTYSSYIYPQREPDPGAPVAEGSEPVLSRATFTIDDVPPGEVVFRPKSMMQSRVAVHVTERSDGDLDADIVLLDSADGPRLTFEDVRGALSIHGHTFYAVTTQEPGVAAQSVSCFDVGWPISFEHAPGQDLEWSATTHGARPIFGTLADLEAREDGAYVGRLAFEPGWGARVVVRDEADAPLVGARVLVDGEVAGLTDARGRLDVAAGALPARLEAELPGWEPVPLCPIDPAAARTTGRFEITLRPADGR